MSEIAQLMREADALGILNIDVSHDQITPEILKIAIDATKEMRSQINKEERQSKLQKVGKVDT
jgi:hypothetical protein